MMSTTNAAQSMIASGEALDGLLDRWRGDRVIAVDTEADSLHSYREKLCLVQLSTGSDMALVDPLAGHSIQPLLDFLGEREIILHGASYDLRMLLSAGDFRPVHVFDTMLAARLTGRGEFSLAALVAEFHQVELTKASRKADWGKRPLSPAMAEYALNDVRYLHALRDEFLRQLDALGRMDWLHQCCEREIRSAMEPSRVEENTREAWRVKGAFRLDDRASAVLRALWHWRNAEAESRDVPVFKIMRNEDLLMASESFAATGRFEARSLRGGRRERFLAAARKALALDASELPARPKTRRREKTPGFDERFERLRALRDSHAKALGLDPSFIAPRSLLEHLSGSPEQRQAARERLLPWQLELISGAIPDD